MTPETLLDRLIGLFPEFAEHWEEPENEAIEEDGESKPEVYVVRKTREENAIVCNRHLRPIRSVR